jgi:hypothetical protein
MNQIHGRAVYFTFLNCKIGTFFSSKDLRDFLKGLFLWREIKFAINFLVGHTLYLDGAAYLSLGLAVRLTWPMGR